MLYHIFGKKLWIYTSSTYPVLFSNGNYLLSLYYSQQDF